MSQKVLVISGSDRDGSFNTQLAEQLVEALENEGQSAEVYDFSAIPLLSQNSEFPAPASVEKLRADIANAAGLILVSPEYNGSYPARLKNLIDWASRAVIAGDNTTPTVLNGKKVGVASVANSTYGKFVRENLRNLVPYVRADLMEGEGLGIRIPGEAWGTGKLELEEEQQKNVDQFVADYLKFLAA
ncbi:NADPH-dependent FMN reductase [Rothia nasimurium]|uniref:NADPH-dependent FMN reductase n=1 Tax=Rothia nasimurium TaxID=85336 RepID=UPI001F38DDF5|nr:NADPH-dependent FMN reductase [Rothia nasimurium]